MENEILCEVKNLHKTFRQGGRSLEVIRGLDLAIGRGEAISIVGASGVGKSTLLHIVGTLDRPTSGSVKFKGKNLFLMKEGELARFRNRSIGFVFQFHHLLSEFTALENVMMPGLIGGKPRGELSEAAVSLIREVGLMGRLHHRPGELSGGEQQRIALARALVLSPELLLADEFTGNLDTDNANRVADLLFQLNEKRGAAIVAVTHDRIVAKRFKTMYEMSEGKLHP